MKVGDRVAAYNANYRYTGVITDCAEDHTALVKHDDAGGSNWFHRFQLRRLVKKKRRRIWVTWPHLHFNGHEANVHTHKPLVDADYDVYEFVEVRKPRESP